MPVYDTNDYAIKTDLFAQKLVGSLCEITFVLKHYSMGAQGAVEAHNVFSAHVEAISILKKAPVIAPSPFKGQGKRPQHRPQIPTRGEQVNAATAFIPQPGIGLTPTAHRTVAGNIAATFATHRAPSTFITISGDGSTLPLPPTPIADDTTNFSPPPATPVNAITTGEVPISTPAGTIGDSLPITSTSTQPLDSVDADGSVMQAPPSKKRRVKE
jgi:hypothetical protein